MGVTQSLPENPGAHWHPEDRHLPLPEQAFGHRLASHAWRMPCVQPSSQLQKPPSQIPWPLHKLPRLTGHRGDAQSDPPYASSHKQCEVALKTQRPWPEQRRGHSTTSSTSEQVSPLNPLKQSQTATNSPAISVRIQIPRPLHRSSSEHSLSSFDMYVLHRGPAKGPRHWISNNCVRYLSSDT